MIRIVLLSVFLFSLVISSPVPTEEEVEIEVMEDRGLIEDMIMNTITSIITQQIYNILATVGITTTTTTTTAAPCGPLGLICNN